jgi:serine/threonine protein kinase/tetratricopeptide (TPR) repeat protein
VFSGTRFEFEGTERFQVLRRLGSGGMGVVYEAFDRERNTRVALKTLRSIDAVAVLRFKNEFRWLQDLSHPNLVSFHELFAESGQWFFTMELIEGVDILSFVRHGRSIGDEPVGDEHSMPNAPTLNPAQSQLLAAAMGDGAPPPPLLDEGRLRAALSGLARGLNALHVAHKVHRDIKPSNILVAPTGRVVLLDFGLAKEQGVHDVNQSDQHVVGTVSYMAPEQAASKPVGPEADWYSVGTIVYEALTGKLPFAGPPLEVLIAKQSKSPPPPRAVTPGVPADLDRLCVDLLKPDPAARPGGAEILRRLGVADTIEVKTSTSQSGGPAPFVGRKQELDTLRLALEDVRAGKSLTVYVQGESGVGKSVLARRFVDQLAVEDPRSVVLAGRCYERETVPYKAFDGIVDALSRYMTRLPKGDAAALLPLRAALLAQVFPVLRRVEAVAQAPLPRNEVPSPQELRQRVFAALRELLARLAERQPLVLVVDDLQWADGDSLALLAEVMRPPDAPSLLLIATVRVSSESNPSGAFDLPSVLAGQGGEVRHVQVRRLDKPESRELVALLLGDSRADEASPRRAMIDTIADEAGGHPLFIDELVRHANSNAREGSGGGRLRLEEALWARVQLLEQPVRALLELVVVAGAPLVQEIAAQAAAIEFADFGKRASALRVAHLVRTGGARRTDSIEPYHDRVREAVLQHLDMRSRKKCHERLALALEAHGDRADPEALSVHWRGAGDLERAAHYAAVAARQAAQALAFDRSARLYRLAIELRPIDGPQYQAQLGAVLQAAGRGGKAALAYLEAAKGANLAESLELQRKAAEQLLISGHVDQGLQALERVLETFKMRVPQSPGEALRALLWQRMKLRLRGLGWKTRDATEISPATLGRIDACWSVGVGLGLVDNVRGAAFSTRHLLLALEAGEPYRVARGLAQEAVFAAYSSRPERAQALVAQVKTMAQVLPQPHALGLAQLAAGFAAFVDGRWKAALTELNRAEATLRERCTGVAWELDTTHLLTLISLFFTGQLGELRDEYPLIYRSAVERGDLFATTNLSTVMHVYWLLRDDPERARAEADAAMKRWSHGGFHTQHYNHLLALGNIALYCGDPERALSLVDGSWDKLHSSQQMRTRIVRIQMHDLRARSLLGLAGKHTERRAERLREAEALAKKLLAEKNDWPAGYGQVILAQASALRGDGPGALSHLDQATRSFERADMTLHVHGVRWWRGKRAGSDEGRSMMATTERYLKKERVIAPVRVMRLLAPGFSDEA